MARFMMCLEMPVLAFALAKANNSEFNLTAFGGLLVPIGYFFESPVWNLIGSSAALVRSKEDLKIFYRFLILLSLVIALIYLILILSPLATLLVIPFFGSNNELYSQTLPSLMIGTLWPFIVGYRRINHGVLVHVGKSKLITATSLLRLSTLSLTLTFTHFNTFNLSGITLSAICLTIAVALESMVSKVLLDIYALPKLTDEPTKLTVKSTATFCSPLVFSAIISQIIMPLGSAVLFRLPLSQMSLVIWPALNGLLSISRTPGSALIELTAAHGGSVENRKSISNFANKMAVALGVILFVLAATNLGKQYFLIFGGLSEENANFAARCLFFAILFPAIEVKLWYFCGCIYALKQTKLTVPMTLISLALALLLFPVGVYQTYLSGAEFLLLLLVVCTITQVAYLSFHLSKFKTA